MSPIRLDDLLHDMVERNSSDLFLKAGLPVPLRLMIPVGKDLTDFMKGGKTE